MGELAWGAKVSEDFRNKVALIAGRLAVAADDLMACMAFESARTFRPDIRNAAGSGAVGLIQFMPATAQALGTSTAELAAMTAEQQLDFVEKYFAPHQGKLQDIEDVYMAILWPAAIGKPSDTVIFDRDDAEHPQRYLQNRGLDKDGDGKVTKAEAAAGPRALLDEGQRPENLA
ncbi:MAG TPA: transglycosylase SLT domain-containing protein [Stellaceae bacterium]|nr:transglycosylase SLT domain-containing protein [Stellaceae bacterium]